MFRIKWSQSALDELASVWMRADSAVRQAITVATHALKQQLRNNAKQQGESQAEEERILFAPPLGISFEVDAQLHSVTIRHIWTFRKRGQ